MTTTKKQAQQQIDEALKPKIKTWQDRDAELSGITWLWKGWFPNGMVTLVCGRVGAAKSATLLDLSREITEGGDFPDGKPAQQGKVVWVDLEGTEGMNQERAKSWNIDLTKLIEITNFQIGNPAAIEALETAAAIPDVRLIVIDSLGAAVVDESKPETMLFVLKCAEIAKKNDIAVAILHHPRKLSQWESQGVITLDRVRGSSKIVQFARSVIAIDFPDPAQPLRRRWNPLKLSPLALPEPLGFDINQRVQDPDHFDVFWTTAPSKPKREGPREVAINLLMVALDKGPKPIEDLKKLSTTAQISWRTMKRARTDIGIVTVKMPGSQELAWSLPAVQHSGYGTNKPGATI